MRKTAEDFEPEALKMWETERGYPYVLPIDFNQLEKLNIGKIKTAIIKKMFPVRNVNYFIKGNEIYIQESKNIYDWKQNFMAFLIKVKIADEYVRVHAGFYLTAMTIFYHMKKNNLLNDFLVFRAYSHGAGAAPLLALRIFEDSYCIPSVPGNFESPTCIFLPSKRIKHLCRHFCNFIQGDDIVTKVPMWMSHLGYTVKIKGRKLPWYLVPFKSILNHDIRGIKNKRSLYGN